MSSAWDAFIAGFDPPVAEPVEELDASDVFVQMDALHDARVERNDPKWFPRGPDPQAVERLARDRQAKGANDG